MREGRFEAQVLPTLYHCDAVVVDGSLAGIAVALTLARAGHRTAVIERRTYLGREITATLRPWLPPPGPSSDLPEPLTACYAAGQAVHAGKEIALRPDAVKRALEDLLLEAGVWLLYGSTPVSLVTRGQQIEGVVIGGKSGRQVIGCRLFVDSSATALLARLAGADVAPRRGSVALFGRTIEFTGLVAALPEEVAVSPTLGISGDRVRVHRGYRGPGHAIVEFDLALPADADDALDITARELTARRASMELAAWLGQSLSAFTGAWLAALSYESLGPNVSAMRDHVPPWATPLAGVSCATGQVAPWPLSGMAGPLAGLWCLNEAARGTTEQRALLRDPRAAGALGACLGEALRDNWPAQAHIAPPEAAQVSVDDNDEGVDAQERCWRIVEPTGPQVQGLYPPSRVPAQAIPVCYEADVLVAGGGTSGAVAAISAADAGAAAFLVDMNPVLGGTGTVGGVHSYWFGRRVGFAARVIGWVDEVHDRLGYPRLHGDVPAWNVEAKAHALAGAARAAGVGILLDSAIIAAVAQGDRVCGAVAATPTGPVTLIGRAVIDATGDGDVAVSAGASFTYGAARDRATMWYSLAQHAEPGQTRNNFTSMVDVGEAVDYTRAILAGRRRGEPTDYDHGTYLAPRESRHIHGDVTLTLNDQLLQRCWPDVVCVAFSNNDIKGQTASDWLRVGLIPPNLEIEIPYRALLPSGLEGLLVVGKALSATHDALPSIRMQADLENLGGAAGLAAAMAVQQGSSLRALDVGALQVRLVGAGALPTSILARILVPFRYTKPQLRTVARSLSAENPLHAYSDMEMDEVYRDRIPLVDLCCAGPHALPVLVEALADATGPRQLRLAQALALLGDEAGVPVLVAAILDRLAAGVLPPRRAHVRHTTRFAPDQGAMPETANLLYALGMARDRRALPVWQRVVDLLATVHPDDICSHASGVFHYVDAVCLGAERSADPAAAPTLQQLHGYPAFRGQRLTTGFQEEYLPERWAYLEIAIGRALARCASPEGILILIGYMEDVRAVLAASAHDELIALAGQNLGADIAAWYAWLEVAAEGLRPLPSSAPPEPSLVWGQRVLILPQ